MQVFGLIGSDLGRGGLVTLKDSGWVLSLSIFHQSEIIGQPPGTDGVSRSDSSFVHLLYVKRVTDSCSLWHSGNSGR
jgi:myosin-crossreactive antigen